MGLEIDNFPKVIDLQHGKHYKDCLEGRVFSQAATPLGLAIPIYTGTALAGGMPIWNPATSNFNVELISVTTAYASGTSVYAAVGLMARSGLGSDLASGSQITAFAATTPINGLIGGGMASQVKSSNAGVCTVTAGTAGEWIRTLFSLNLEAATGTAHGVVTATFDFNGTVIVAPGTMVWLGASLASVALYASTIVWKEIPIF